MPIAAGTRFGSYEVATLIGSGGMGEVYRARDVELGRDVALKVLPTSFTSDATRVARFEQEAKTLASLGHANIAYIYGLERSEGATALAMELVDGPTLAERIAQGRVSVEEALRVANQIADGLAAAHERGIVHRDLKPANIKLKADGTVKLLDFGIAKVLDSRTATGPGPAALTTPAMTEAGIVLGTAAYMSPEQARGKAVDQRADIWAFGCVLYEMLVGHLAFVGDDVSIVLARVLERDVDLDALPPRTPPAVRRTIELCLEKDTGRRIADIRDVKLALAGRFEVAAAIPRAGNRALSRGVLAVSIAVATLLAGLVGWNLRPVAPRQVIRSTLELGGASGAAVTGVGVSPDGTRLAYLSAAGVQVRPLDRPDATLVPGTAGASDVFFSPDGRWIGFWQGGRLKRTSRDGDAAVVLAELPLLWGADWANDGTILLGQGPEGIARISAAGGARETIISDPMRLARAPQLLPGGRAVLFTSAPLSFNWNEARAMVHVLNTHESRVLIPNASNAHYVSTGHLVYVSGGRLMAVPFDAKTLTVTGAPTLIAEQVAGVVGGNTRGDSYYSVSEAGLLAYVARNDAKLARTLAWVDRQGREEPINAPPRTYFYARLSPDGKRAALDVRDQDEDIWLYDFEQETLTRLTLEPSRERAPAWTADGKRVLFDSNREGPPNIYWQNADGTGAAERLTTSSNAQFAATITRDGRSVLFQETIEPRFFIMQLDVGSGRAPAPLLGTTFLQRNPRVSPNGKFIAYESNETGRFEIYVRPFPDIDSGRWLVSTAGGLAPVWSPMGDELFYESPTGELMTVKIGPGSSWVAQRPVVLADASHDWSLGGFSAPSYDVSPDGKRFLVIKRDPGGERPQNSARVVLVSNWFEELRRQNAAN